MIKKYKREIFLLGCGVLTFLIYQNFTPSTQAIPSWIENYRNISFANESDFAKVISDPNILPLGTVTLGYVANTDPILNGNRLIAFSESICSGKRNGASVPFVDLSGKKAIHVGFGDKFSTSFSWILNSQSYLSAKSTNPPGLVRDPDIDAINQYLYENDKIKSFESLLVSLCESYFLTKNDLTTLGSFNGKSNVQNSFFKLASEKAPSFRYVFGTLEYLDPENLKYMRRAGVYIAPTHFFNFYLQRSEGSLFKFENRSLPYSYVSITDLESSSAVPSLISSTATTLSTAPELPYYADLTNNESWIFEISLNRLNLDFKHRKLGGELTVDARLMSKDLIEQYKLFTLKIIQVFSALDEESIVAQNFANNANSKINSQITRSSIESWSEGF
jgi:hypothetical protein